MKKIKHWTPRYIFNRSREILYRSFNSELPWLTQKSNVLLNNHLQKYHKGLEFGSGKSTIWFAKKTGHITSIESSKIWFKKIKNIFKKKNITNINLVYIDSEDKKVFEKYDAILNSFKNNELDYVIIDGRHRDYAALNALNKIKKNGIIVIDNINRYFPSSSFAPNSVPSNSQPINNNWIKIHKILYDKDHKWDCVWTSNGVTDTAIYRKKF